MIICHASDNQTINCPIPRPPLHDHYACDRSWLHRVISSPSDELLAQVDDSELSKLINWFYSASILLCDVLVNHLSVVCKHNLFSTIK